MTATRYPKATWKGDGKSGGAWIGKPYRVVLHTTETQGLPIYGLGASAPHLTYNPKTRIWIQHTDLSTAARAMRNLSGGVETNRANAIQVEIICYSAKGIADIDPTKRLWVGNLPDTAYTDLKAFISWCATEFGVKAAVWPGKQATSYGQANAAGFRMTSSVWNAFNGVCGHQHVPENLHWDPGALDWSKLMKGAVAPVPPTPTLWNSLDDSVDDLADADAVFEFHGGYFMGQDVATYLAKLGNPSAEELESRSGILIGIARMAVEDMKNAERLRKAGIPAWTP